MLFFVHDTLLYLYYAVMLSYIRTLVIPTLYLFITILTYTCTYYLNHIAFLKKHIAVYKLYKRRMLAWCYIYIYITNIKTKNFKHILRPNK